MATGVLGGLASTIAANSLVWVFVGPTANVTVTAAQRLTGTATSSLAAAGNTTARIDLCYQNSGGGTVTNFSGFNYIIQTFSAVRVPYTAAGSVVPGVAATYKVGLCALNGGVTAINNNDYVNGYVQVTN